VVSRNALTQPAPLGWTNAASFVPALVFVALTILAYAIKVWVFKGKSLGGWAWLMPFVLSSAVAIWGYRRLCIQIGVLTDAESLELGRNILVLLLLACAVLMSVLSGSLVDGLSSALLGLPIVATLLVGGLVFVKAQLLMHETPDRADQNRMGEDEIAELRANFRRQKGIADLPKDRTYTPGSVSASSNAPYASAAANDTTLRTKALPELPPPTKAATRPPVPTPAPRQSPNPSPASTPMPLASSEAEIRQKILAVRAAALKAQRKASKTKPGDL
jgi:hypothetical protein